MLTASVATEETECRTARQAPLNDTEAVRRSVDAHTALNDAVKKTKENSVTFSQPDEAGQEQGARRYR